MQDLTVPDQRIAVVHDAPVAERGEYVLYWMTANRRGSWNFALQRAADWAARLRKPLLVLEPLRCGYRWASDRFHRFVIDGMADNARTLDRRGVLYYPYLEPFAGRARGLLAALARRACVVIGDDYPCFFHPRMLASAARQISVRWEQVDTNGLLPMKAAPSAFRRAYDFRRFLQKSLLDHLGDAPLRDPLHGLRLPEADLPLKEIRQQWPPVDARELSRPESLLAGLPIDHQVAAVPPRGGMRAATDALRQFLSNKLAAYDTDRNQPEREVTSGLAPYLHFGHISSHQVFHELMEHEDWSPARVAGKVTGSAQGWWGISAGAEGFVDQLVTWRELGFNLCSKTTDYDQYDSLPDWARRTLQAHARDRRDYVYDFEQFDAADTHDPLWNAAQRQLVTEGRMHNYLRMLWGKKILQWSADPRGALDTMIELNNRYALDGRDPNSYSGIFWCLGRYDRPWAPERPVFGQIRYMSSENTARKVRVRDYIRRYGKA